MTTKEEELKNYKWNEIRKDFLEGKEVDFSLWSKLDELLCIPGSLAHDKKLSQERENYLKSIAMQGGCVSLK